MYPGSFFSCLTLILGTLSEVEVANWTLNNHNCLEEEV